MSINSLPKGLAGYLKTKKLIEKIYPAKNGKEAVDKALTENIDCVIIDINMPILNGLEASRIFKKKKPGVLSQEGFSFQ